MNVSVFCGVNNCKVLGRKIFITSSGTTYLLKICKKSVFYTFRKFTNSSYQFCKLVLGTTYLLKNLRKFRKYYLT